MKAWWKVAVKGSVASALAFMVAMGCDDEDGAPVASNGGEGGADATGAAGSEPQGGSEAQAGGESGGTSSGASAGMGGFAIGGYCASASDICGGGTGNVEPSSGGGGGQAAAGAAGAAAGDPDASVARFCNGISDDGQNVTFILEVGEGDEKVTFTANSFECAPPDGAACLPIPLGLEVPVALYEEGDPVPWYEGTLFSEAQDQWLLYTILQPIGDDAVPSVEGTTTNGEVACDDTTYEHAYPP